MRKMNMAEAFEAGSATYYLGKRCGNGHRAPRLMANHKCTACLAEADKPGSVSAVLRGSSRRAIDRNTLEVCFVLPRAMSRGDRNRLAEALREYLNALID